MKIFARRYAIATILLLISGELRAQEWRSYGGDPGGSRYSKLKEINKSNVSTLKLAWTYHAGDYSDGSEYSAKSAFETTPLVINGVMYLTTPFSRVIALEAETGKELWAFDPKIDKDQTYPLFVSRGAAWWSDGAKQRVFFGTRTAGYSHSTLRPVNRTTASERLGTLT